MLAIGVRFHHVATDQDRGNLRTQGADARDQPRPLHPRHSRIGNDRVDFFNLIARRFQPSGAVFAGDHVVPGALEDLGKQEPHRAVVLDHQNGFRSRGGRSICVGRNQC